MRGVEAGHCGVVLAHVGCKVRVGCYGRGERDEGVAAAAATVAGGCGGRRVRGRGMSACFGGVTIVKDHLRHVLRFHSRGSSIGEDCLAGSIMGGDVAAWLGKRAWWWVEGWVYLGWEGHFAWFSSFCSFLSTCLHFLDFFFFFFFSRGH